MARPAVLKVCDTNPQVLADFAEHFPQAECFDNADEMLAEPTGNDDIVIVATPPFARLKLTLRTFESGRHVLCEKPLAMSREQALQMLDAAKRHDRLLACSSCRFLGLPAHERVKQLLRRRELGEVYHVTFVHREQRLRSGIEYQPASRWFLDRSKSGGGVLMDWGGYEMTTLNDLFQPQRVEILAAWMAQPETAVDPTDGSMFDVETHLGASLRYHCDNREPINVTYERSSCTHGRPQKTLEIEGTRGAVTWDWIHWEGQGKVTVSCDHNGRVQQHEQVLGTGEMDCHDKPLQFLWQRIHGHEAPAVLNEDAVFNFSCVRAVYDCAETGQPQRVTCHTAV